MFRARSVDVSRTSRATVKQILKGFYSPYNADPYAQALAEERVALDQYANALRQQEEARERVARARLAREAYGSPHSSYLSSSAEDDDFPGGKTYALPHTHTYQPSQCNGYRASRYGPQDYGGYGMSPQQQRALYEDQRLKEMAETGKAREVERMRQLMEEERQRQVMEEDIRRRIREEESRRRVQEEEQIRKQIMEEERRIREQENLRRQRQDGLEKLYRDLGWRPFAAFEPPEQPPSRRARTTSPPYRRSPPQTQPTMNKPRTSSEWSHPKPAEQPQPKPASPKQPSFAPEQAAAVVKIQNFYRKRFPRYKALQTLSSLQTRFEELKSPFKLPSRFQR
ncbi:unnamed protein product [Somion occarium]|uniref:Uncharacterized protein n=1 Tax=Somion occarium TaxID=3059160 RepID=A0ABP1CRH3_9APHY